MSRADQSRAGVEDQRAVCRIGPLEVEVESKVGALNRLVSAVINGTSGTWGFCNAHTVNMAVADAEFRGALGKMTLFNDGSGLNIARRLLLGQAFPENLNGTDLTPELLGTLPPGSSVYLLGGAPGIVEKAAEAITNDFPKLSIAGLHHGYFGRTHEPEIVADIVQSRAALVIVGMGHPLQELWAVRNMYAIEAPVICVGAMIDRLAGEVKRAPKLMRRFGIEWLFRLLQEPRRLGGRYIIGNFIFLLTVIRQRREYRNGASD